MNTTAQLLGVRPRRKSPWVERLAVVAERLKAEYGVPGLGNFRDPVKEIFYILLSAKTTHAQYRATHRNLWNTYPKLSDLANASIPEIRKCILSGGLAGKRARQIRRTARALIAAGEFELSEMAVPLKSSILLALGRTLRHESETYSCEPASMSHF